MVMPKTQANSAIDQLNAAIHAGCAPSEFQLKQWARFACALLNKSPADAAEGYQVLGMLATFSGDVDEVEANFGKASQLAAGDLSLAHRYICSLVHVGYAARALNVLYAIRLPGGFTDPALCADAIHVLLINGLVHNAADWMDQCPEEVTHFRAGDAMNSFDPQWPQVAAAQLANLQVAAAWSDGLHCAETLLRETLGARMFAVTYQFHLIPEFGPALTVRAPVSVESAVELNFQLAERWAAQLDCLLYCSLEQLPTLTILPHAQLN